MPNYHRGHLDPLFGSQLRAIAFRVCQHFGSFFSQFTTRHFKVHKKYNFFGVTPSKFSRINKRCAYHRWRTAALGWENKTHFEVQFPTQPKLLFIFCVMKKRKKISLGWVGNRTSKCVVFSTLSSGHGSQPVVRISVTFSDDARLFQLLGSAPQNSFRKRKWLSTRARDRLELNFQCTESRNRRRRTHLNKRYVPRMSTSWFQVSRLLQWKPLYVITFQMSDLLKVAYEKSPAIVIIR